jgi:hypothetical protein
MAEYYLGVYRQLERFPHQIVIFVGEDPLRMKDELVAPAMSHRYQLIDIRTLDAVALLGSAELDDNMLAILGRVVDERGLNGGAIIDHEAPRERRIAAVEK